MNIQSMKQAFIDIYTDTIEFLIDKGYDKTLAHTYARNIVQDFQFCLMNAFENGLFKGDN